MTGDIVVLGSVNRDVVTEVAALPGPGETVTATRTRTNIGGKGANQAVAAYLLGARVRLVARVGDDPESAAAVSGLAATGLDVGAVRAVPGQRCGAAYIAVSGGENTIIVDPGANHVWPDGLGADAELVASAGLLVLQQEVPTEVNELAAATSSARLVLNAAPSRPVGEALLARCDPLVVNVHELADQLGGPVDDVSEAMVALLRRGARSVVTTLGADGARWARCGVSGTLEAGAVAAAAVAVADSTGAGDAFVGALAGELLTGRPLSEGVRWAVMAASASVRVAGTHASYPDRDAVRALLA